MNARTRWDPLAGTRPDFMPDPHEPVDPARRDRDLRAILDTPRPTVTRRNRPRLAAVAVAAVVAAAVVVITPGAQGPTAQASPRDVLLAAADAVATTPEPTSGRYWHRRERGESTYTMPAGPGHGRYELALVSDRESWFSRTGAEDSVLVYSIDATVRPLTQADEAEWIKAGRPTGVPGIDSSTSVIRRAGENSYNVAAGNRSIPELLALPTDAAELKAYLLTQFHEIKPLGVDLTDETGWLVEEAEALLFAVPTTRGTRAAAYRMLAALPGYRVLAPDELPAGAGVGLARTARGGWNDVVDDGLIEYQLIIDPDTGLLRSNRLVLREPGTEKRKLPPGTVLYANTVVDVGWTDTEPVVPPGARDDSNGMPPG